MDQSEIPNAKTALAEQPHTASAEAPDAGVSSADDKEVSKTADPKDVAAAATARMDDPPAEIPKYHVQSLYGTYEVIGVDAIWHNQYAGPDSDFGAFRKQYDSDINAMILKVADHVRRGLYTVVSMNATLHMLTVVCICESFQADFPDDIWDEPLR